MNEDRQEEHLGWGWVFGIVAAFTLFTCISNFLFPIFEAPDEPSHFLYARLIANGKLPVLTDPKRYAHAEGCNPPLYYVLTAPVLAIADPKRGAEVTVMTSIAEQRRIAVTRALSTGRFAPDYGLLPPRNPLFVWWGIGKEKNWFTHPLGDPFHSGPLLAVHLMRFISCLCGIMTLLGVFMLARECLPNRPMIQFVALAFVAFNPQFVYISSVLNNDNLVTTFSVWVLWQIAVLLRSDHATHQRAFILGLLIGVGILAKTNILFLTPVALASFWVRRTSPRSFLEHGAILALCIVTVSGWFFIRNGYLYGPTDLFGWKTLAALDPIFLLPAEQRWEFFTQHFLKYVFLSFWGLFGWLTIPMRDWHYAYYGALTLMILLSLRVFRREQRFGGLRPAFVLCASVVGLNLTALTGFNLLLQANQGRLLFPSIGAFAVLFGIAAEAATGSMPVGWRNGCMILFFMTLIAVLVHVQSTVIYPVYFQQ